MDENEVMQTETADSWDDDYLAGETFEDSDGDDWAEDYNDDGGEDQPDSAEESEAEETEETAEEESTEPETETQTEEPQQEIVAKSFKLKHLDEEIEVDENKVIELAQKGMDYDRIRGKYDETAKEMPRYREYEAFLNELAAGSNQTIQELIDSSRARMLIASEKSEGRTIGEAEAMLRVQRQRKSAEAPAEPAEEKAEPEAPKQPDAQAIRKQQFMDIVNAFPDVKAEEIPKSVFDEAQKTGNIFTAYANYRMNLLAEENKKLKLEQKNRQRATGSMQSKGTAPKKDKFDALWYDGT